MNYEERIATFTDLLLFTLLAVYQESEKLIRKSMDG